MAAPSSARQFSPFEPVELASQGAPVQPALDLHPQARFVLDRIRKRAGEVVSGLVPRHAIQPQDFAVALPNIAMIDLKFDDDGEFTAHATIVGEELASRYGLRRGPLNMPPVNAEADRRFREAIRYVHRVRCPVAVRAPSLVYERAHHEIRGLYIPYSRTGDLFEGVLLHAVLIRDHR